MALDFKTAFLGLGGPALVRRLAPHRLTVLCYHRIGDPQAVAGTGDPDVVSATPEMFARQMDHLARRFSPIGMDDLIAALATPASGKTGRGAKGDDARLPPNPVLVTFDDGYRDTLESAWPIMERAGVPLTLFLATAHIGSERPFFWDFAHACLGQTDRAAIALPGEATRRPLTTARDRAEAAAAWSVWAKTLDLEARDAAMADLARAAGGGPDPALFRRRMITWDEARAIQDRVHLGCHGARHPVYARLSAAAAAADIRDSIATYTQALGRPPVSFAFPNGGAGDQGPREAALLVEAGIRVAFLLEPGPCLMRRARTARYGIPRVTIGNDDDLRALEAKCHGSSRIARAVKDLIYRAPPPGSPPPSVAPPPVSALAPTPTSAPISAPTSVERQREEEDGAVTGAGGAGGGAAP